MFIKEDIDLGDIMALDNKKARRSYMVNKAEEDEFGLRNSAAMFNSTYHHFFEGYSEQMVPKKSGKGNQIIRTYIGNYYKRICSDRAWIIMKVMYMTLFLLAVCIYFFALTRRVDANTVWYVAVPGLLSIILIILLFAKLVACLATKRTMEIYDFKYVFGRVFLFSAITASMLCVTAAMNIVFVILIQQSDLSKEIQPALCCIISAVIIGLIGQIERKAKYETIENTAVPNPNSIII